VNLGVAFETAADFIEGSLAILTVDASVRQMGRRRGVSAGGASPMSSSSIADPRRPLLKALDHDAKRCETNNNKNNNSTVTSSYNTISAERTDERLHELSLHACKWLR
jgi:hypothetical protein